MRGDQLFSFFVSDFNHAVMFIFSLCQNTIPLSENLLGPFNFFRYGDSHLVDEVDHLVFIDDNVMGKG